MHFVTEQSFSLKCESVLCVVLDMCVCYLVCMCSFVGMRAFEVESVFLCVFVDTIHACAMDLCVILYLCECHVTVYVHLCMNMYFFALVRVLVFGCVCVLWSPENLAVCQWCAPAVRGSCCVSLPYAGSPFSLTQSHNPTALSSQLQPPQHQC